MIATFKATTLANDTTTASAITSISSITSEMIDQARNVAAKWDPNVRPTLDKIDLLRNLEDDWDDEGGIAATHAATEVAKAAVQATARNATETGVIWHRPTVAATNDGGVDLSWYSGGRRLWVRIRQDGRSLRCLIYMPGFGTRSVDFAYQPSGPQPTDFVGIVFTNIYRGQ